MKKPPTDIVKDYNGIWWKTDGDTFVRMKKIEFNKDVEINNDDNGLNINRKN